MQIIDGKKISQEIFAGIKKEIEALPFKPVFCDVLVGSDPASRQYVDMKRKKAEGLGIEFHEAFFPESISQDDLVQEIQKINKIPNMCGVIVQLPLPAVFDTRKVLDVIDPSLDVDCLSSISQTKFYNAEKVLYPPTALACLELLDNAGVDLPGKSILVLGYGVLVGKPVYQMLKSRGLEPKLARSTTEDKDVLIKNADIIISGIGQGHYLKREMLKDGVCLIDAGTSEDGGSLVGDVDFDSVEDMPGMITPVPGGVGPVTVAMLFRNVLEVARNKLYE